MSFRLILLVTALNGSAVYAIRPMATYRALQLGAGPVEIGLVASSYAAIALFAALFIGRAADRLGPLRFLVIGASLVAASALEALLVDSVVALAIGQAVLGLGQIMNQVAGQTLVANDTVRDKRDERFGHYAVAGSGGQLVGPAVAGVLAGGAGFALNASFNPAPALLFAGWVAISSSAIAASQLIRARHTRVVSARVAPLSHLSAVGAIVTKPGIPQAMLASVAVILSVDLLVAYLPALGQASGLPVQLVGLLLAIRAGGSMVSRLFMGTLLHHFERGHILAASMVLAGLAIATLPFMTQPLVLMALMLLTGLGLGLGQPMTVAWVANRVPRDQRGTALAIRLTGNRLGQLILPSVMGAIAGVGGLAGMFLVLAATLATGALVVNITKFDI